LIPVQFWKVKNVIPQATMEIIMLLNIHSGKLDTEKSKLMENKIDYAFSSRNNIHFTIVNDDVDVAVDV
jgi:hypothetical protein